MRKFLLFLTAIMLNGLIGALAAGFVDLDPIGGAVGLNTIAIGASFLPKQLGFKVGVYADVWTGFVAEHFTHFEQNTFLNGVPDFSRYADNDTIHLVDVAGDPTVVIDNKTYPLEVETLDNEDIAIKLAKFETKPTSITDDELYAISYDKMRVVKDRHGNKLGEARLDKAIHAFAPSTNTAKTPVLLTTGELDGTRKRLTLKDILTLKSKLDKLKVPKSGRRLVLCSDHINDLLALDQKFSNQYHNYSTGEISKVYGFEIHEYVNCPYFKQNGTKVAFGTTATTGEYEASVFFYVPRMFKAQGSTKVYYSEAKTDPLNKRNLISFTNRFVALPQVADCACGAIVSAYVAG